MRQLVDLVRIHGLMGTAWVVSRRLLRQPAKCWPAVAEYFLDKQGLELGGPTQAFRAGGLFPVYPLLQNLDGANFAEHTLWEGSIQEGQPYRFDAQRAGRQYIRDATHLHGIGDHTYDVVLHSHMIEHVANPLRAMAEMRRVLKPDGIMGMIVPHRDGVIYDRHRPIDTIEHLLKDFRDNTQEDEQGAESFRTRNTHHHCFNGLLVARMLDAAGFDIVAMEIVRPFNIIAVAKVSNEPTNAAWLDPSAQYLKGSPFRSDH